MYMRGSTICSVRSHSAGGRGQNSHPHPFEIPEPVWIPFQVYHSPWRRWKQASETSVSLCVQPGSRYAQFVL